MVELSSGWTLNGAEPRAPSVEQWARMSEAERGAAVAALPSHFPMGDAPPRAGDHHFDTLVSARGTLTRWFREQGRHAYVSGNLPVYYPGAPVFSPDVFVVLDTLQRPRRNWVVSREGGRGPNFALDVVVSGQRRNDLHGTVKRCTELGITEYFVFDFSRRSLTGFRLGEGGAHERCVPEGGRHVSQVLGLRLSIDDGRLRFAAGDVLIPEREELLAQLSDQARRAEERIQSLEMALAEERRLRAEAETQIAALRAGPAVVRAPGAQWQQS